MPEGPELFLSSVYINRICSGIFFSGKVVKNPIHKCQDISWNEPSYTISAESKGKELMLHLQSSSNDIKKSNGNGFRSILFTFGMSGKFEFAAADSMPKHSHLIFYTKSEPKMGLAFVDYRRFGKWIEGGDWSDERGPCVIQEPDRFIKNVAANLNNSAFSKPICEAMLNQKIFSGIGNYLRAEILFRCKVAPFEKARSVLQLKEAKQEPNKDVAEDNQSVVDEKRGNGKNICSNNGPADAKSLQEDKSSVLSDSESKSIKMEKTERCDHEEMSIDCFTLKAQELLKLCTSVPLEVISIGSTKYSLSELYKNDGEGKSFNDWLQCYYQEGMKKMADHNKRTIWFDGPAGPMAPSAEQKVRGKKKSKKSSKEEIKIEESHKANAQEMKTPSSSNSLTRTKLKNLKQKSVKTAVTEKKGRINEKEKVNEQSRKRKTQCVSESPACNKKTKMNQPSESVPITQRLTRSSTKIEQ